METANKTVWHIGVLWWMVMIILKANPKCFFFGVKSTPIPVSEGFGYHFVFKLGKSNMLKKSSKCTSPPLKSLFPCSVIVATVFFLLWLKWDRESIVADIVTEKILVWPSSFVCSWMLTAIVWLVKTVKQQYFFAFQTILSGFPIVQLTQIV